MRVEVGGLREENLSRSRNVVDVMRRASLVERGLVKPIPHICLGALGGIIIARAVEESRPLVEDDLVTRLLCTECAQTENESESQEWENRRTQPLGLREMSAPISNLSFYR